MKKATAVPALSRRDRLRSMLADLKMPGALEPLDPILQGVDGGTLTPGEAIELLLGAQIELRNNHRLLAAMSSSRLSAVKTLQEFDFTFQPSIKREQIESLHELSFLERRENVILLGLPGVCRTHLAIAAAQSGRRVYYGTLVDLIASLEEAQATGHLLQRLTVLTHPSLLVVDEIGNLPISRSGAMLFFQLIGPALRACVQRADQRQRIRGVGRHPRRRGHGRRPHRPASASLWRRLDPGQQLPPPPSARHLAPAR